MIPGTSSQDEALRLALDINPFERLLASALSPAEQACVSYNFRNPVRVKRHRHRAAKRLEFLGESLRSKQAQLTDSLPMLAPARKLHIPLIQRIVGQLGYTDKSLATDSVLGTPIVGVIPRTSSLLAKETPPAMILQDVRGDVRVKNTKVLNSISKSTVSLSNKNDGACHSRNIARVGYPNQPM